MEIENNQLSSIVTRTSGSEQAREKEAASGSAEAAQKAATSDSISLTPIAAQLRELETTIAESPITDIQRVNTVRDAINDGSFEVDPQRIANKLIGFEHALNDAS